MTRHTLHEVATVTYINWLTKKNVHCHI